MGWMGGRGGPASSRAPRATQRGRGHHREGEKGRGMRAHSPRAMRAMGARAPGLGGRVCLGTKGLDPPRGGAPFRSPPQRNFRFPVLISMHLWKGVRMYKIDKGVALPREKVKHDYPHEQLQVGESFLVPGGNMNILCNYNRIKGRKLDRQFVCRKEGNGIRVWRVR